MGTLDIEMNREEEKESEKEIERKEENEKEIERKEEEIRYLPRPFGDRKLNRQQKIRNYCYLHSNVMKVDSSFSNGTKMNLYIKQVYRTN